MFCCIGSWQEVVVEGQDKVFKDVIEPLETVSVNVIPTSKQDIRELGSAQEVSLIICRINIFNRSYFVHSLNCCVYWCMIRFRLLIILIITDCWNIDKKGLGPSFPKNKANWGSRGLTPLISFVNQDCALHSFAHG